jgi:hypothetical protein
MPGGQLGDEPLPASVEWVNDALAIYFADTALANAFVSRWCIGTCPTLPTAPLACAMMSL